ncbi:MAG: hypothetical protein ACI4DS_02940 [Eubacterium sp.]
MRFNKKALAITCVAAMAMNMLSGCGGTDNSIIDYSNATIYGIVESIDGDELTITLGEKISSEALGSTMMSKMPVAENGSSMTIPSDTNNSSSGAQTLEVKDEEGESQNSNSDKPQNMENLPEKPSEGSPQFSDAPQTPDSDASYLVTTDTTVVLTVGDDTLIAKEVSEAGQAETETDSTEVETEAAEISDIEEGSIISITYSNDNEIESICILSNITEQSFNTKTDNISAENHNGTGTGSSTENSGTGANTFDEDAQISDKTYESENEDENAVRVESGVTVRFSDIVINKSGDSSNSEDSDFYGLNAGLLARDGAQVNIDGATVSTTATGANAVFAYGEGTTLTISNSTITTTADNSGGIECAGGATLTASDLNVETNGASCAAIRSDRGGGTVNVNGGNYVTNGTGSPSIYSTADITVSNATLNATTSEAVVVEGQNSVTLKNCNVTGSMSGTYGKDSGENIHNIMIYQSMSGDAAEGQSSFSMTGGSLTSKSGDMFYVTNTACEIYLSDVDMTYSDGNLLTVSGNDGSRGWGSEGSNGGTCDFSADGQTLEGYIYVDEISSLDFSMENGTTFTGSINSDGEKGEVNITIDSSSTWKLTGNTYVTSLKGSTDNIDTNGYTLYVNGVAFN